MYNKLVLSFCVCNIVSRKSASLHGDSLFMGIMGIMREWIMFEGKTFARRGAPSHHLTAATDTSLQASRVLFPVTFVRGQVDKKEDKQY